MVIIKEVVKKPIIMQVDFGREGYKPHLFGHRSL